MSSIKHLELINFKSFKAAKINFGLGLNVITGNNGAGKSNILQAIKFALNGNSNSELILKDKQELSVKAVLTNENNQETTIERKLDLNNNETLLINGSRTNNCNILTCEDTYIADCDEHCSYHGDELEKYLSKLKKNKQSIIVSLNNEVIDRADRLIKVTQHENKSFIET
ncbi:MAG: AAA family ATPase [Candidatus Gastranaerophilales bacterium]|nr:AAA family ATPase [Candidatus Gastranaerophilales bacterium]